MPLKRRTQVLNQVHKALEVQVMLLPSLALSSAFTSLATWVALVFAMVFGLSAWKTPLLSLYLDEDPL